MMDASHAAIEGNSQGWIGVLLVRFSSRIWDTAKKYPSLEAVVFLQHGPELFVRQRNRAVIVDAGQGVGGDHGIDDGLLGGLHGRRENGFDSIVRQHFKVDDTIRRSCARIRR